ncbi:MAG: hypothetical protein QOJ94_575 [Sphingomonadales bacterium]|jgi:hypothetical protein|nr:hypothetical protein [Sphingomonadales bacterium]
MVWRWVLACAAWLCLGGFASAGPRPLASIVVTLAEDGAHVAVKLDRPVNRFEFVAGDVVWGDYADLLTPDLTFKDRVVEGAAPFRTFELRLRPSSEEHDAKYSIFYRVGGGGVLYGPGLAADPVRFRTQIRFRTVRGQVRYPAGNEPAKGLVFIGPPSMVSAGDGFVAVTDPAMPEWLAGLARADLAAAVRLYGDTLGTPLPTRPLLVMKFQEDALSTYVGDVTPGPVVALRFHGAKWSKPDAEAARTIHAFLLHEAFHFWNGSLATPADGIPTWLHEGGADYASLLVGESAGLMSDAEVRQRLGQALNRCRSALQDRGDPALGKAGFLSYWIRYPCGTVLHWAIDLTLRASASHHTSLDVWTATIAAARRRASHDYTLDDFYAAAGIADPGRVTPLALVVDTAGPERWRLLPEALNDLGADVGAQVTAVGRRTAMLFHLLRESCGPPEKSGGFGYYGVGETVKLQSPAACGVLAGDPVLRKVAGGDPFAPSAEIYAEVQRLCAAGKPVTFVTADSRTLAAPCRRPLPDAPPDFTVRRWLPPGAVPLPPREREK